MIKSAIYQRNPLSELNLMALKLEQSTQVKKA